jgi:hypothetical protein
MRRDLEKRLAKLMPAGAGVVETFVFINAPTAAAYRAEQLRLEATGVNGLFVHEGESEPVRSEIVNFPAGMMLDEIDAEARAERVSTPWRYISQPTFQTG